jgi:hypothetical protein
MACLDRLQNHTCFVLCAILKSKRALFAFCTSSSIWLLSRDLKSEAFVGFFFPSASAAATIICALKADILSSGRGLDVRGAAMLHLKVLCELAREAAAPAIPPLFFPFKEAAKAPEARSTHSEA